ncbi:hypothetical protein LWE61_17595 [Sphingobium sufflavum]|uniref:hypothetical protein n=1 Tax=Sphingobium sufflavum TaxID=1129547 RepID=UPI001F3569B9|nr:hypothetical protein [Sphingobium sufflavum]MCE7798355.1 hypothetical protein [Sphingobium sufflavum]
MTENKANPAAEAETDAATAKAPDHEKGNGIAADAPSHDKGNGVTASEKGNGVSSKVWMGTAVGVGSAALVAALMYAKRRK